MNALEVALSRIGAGLCVLPAVPAEKRPALAAWKEYRQHLPTEPQVRAWFAGAEGMCIVAGAVSGNLEMLDFDGGGELFGAWADLVEAEAPGLMDRLVIERSPSGGCHVVYRAAAPVPGNLKLAQRVVQAPDDKPILIAGKSYKPRRVGDRWEVVVTLIETRGEGGIFLCHPSPGYTLQLGDFEHLPVLAAEERGILVNAAQTLTEVVPAADESRPQAGTAANRPGDEFNHRGDVGAVLLRHGWTLAKAGENEYWRRPGKDRGWSATLKGGVFFCFTSNAPPFEMGKAYGPFAVYAHLEHGSDFAKAAAALRAEGFGSDPPAQDGVDLSGILGTRSEEAPVEQQVADPGALPEELLRMPGLVSEVMDFTLDVAPYPNPVMAFCGALALQSLLAGRKVRDQGDNRTNLYLLGLAHSSAGKDQPRKVNTRIAHEIGLDSCLGDRFASGEGIQDSLFLAPAMLFQTDEIDGMLQSINKAKDARHENIMGTLLTMYSSSNSVFPMRRKAGKDHPGSIVQPSLTVFGTAIPNHYYEALSERMLTNGFFARMIVLESGPRPKGQEPRIRDLPPRVLETAKWWAEYRPGTGNLENWHPVPTIVEHTDEARRVLIDAREQAEAEYKNAEQRDDTVGTTVWGRVNENIRKLALIWAVSENHEAPRISVAAAEWATRFVMHLTRRMLYMAFSHVADTPFHAECLKVMQKLREAPGHELSHQVLLKRMKMKSKDFKDLIDTLVQRGDVDDLQVQTGGRTGLVYRMVLAVKEEEGGEGS